MANADAQVVPEAVVEQVVFESDDGKFAVVRMTGRAEPDSNQAAMFTAVGPLGHLSAGETLRLRGNWTSHATYGRRFQVESFTPVMPNSSDGIARYLGSGLIKGVGPALAKRLVDRFGDRTLDVIREQSERLREVSGIGSQRAKSIADSVRARLDEADTMSFLHSVGLGPRIARDVLDKFGEEAARQVKTNPYSVAGAIKGIGFRTADQIGRSCGISEDDLRRVQGATLHALGMAVDEGHVYQTKDELRERVEALEVPTDALTEALDALERQRAVVQTELGIYPPPLYRAECAVAEKLRELSEQSTDGAAGHDIAQHGALVLTEQQRQAVLASLDHRLLVLTGGPGTGKTTTVRAIVQAQLDAKRRVMLCAPTGRAAKRLSEATDYEARTIHRVLEWNPARARFSRDHTTPIEADFVLVDEASMLDLRLANYLCDAIHPQATLVLVGDVDQLPPVGPGQPLRDLIASQICPTIRLARVFRQARQSTIVSAAHSVLEGTVPETTPAGTRTQGDLFVVPATDPEQLQQRLAQTLKRMQEAYGFDPIDDVQIVTPMRRGPFGTGQLNELLQQALNPGGLGASGLPFKRGDKVMQLANDYDREVFNGDLGRVLSVGQTTRVRFDGRDVEYTVEQLDKLSLAYACTVHKVQGSEFPAVIIVLHGSHYVLLSRALLYTALTRAKELVVLLGEPRAIRWAASNAVSYETNSGLTQRLKA